VTNKTGFGFDDRIYWIFMQLVTTVHKPLSDTLSSSSDWTLHGYYSDFQPNSVVLLQFWSELRLTVPSSARTPRKTQSSVVKNVCLLVRYLGVYVLLLLRAYASGMCLSSRCVPMDICITILNRSSSDTVWGCVLHSVFSGYVPVTSCYELYNAVNNKQFPVLSDETCDVFI
jgi:hypothetical protein